MDILEIMNQRHSVRRYSDKVLEPEKREVLNSLIEKINRESNLNIQIIYDEPKCFDSFIAHYGNFSGVSNYIALVGKKSSGTEEKLGFYGEQIVLKAQELGLNTCWVALSHGKSKAVIGHCEKQTCLISIGYGQNNGTSHKSKSVSDVSNCKSDSPEWFTTGVKAALLAPTAINQQKFYFELQPDNTVKATAGLGFYTKTDLGIAKCHFIAATGKSLDIFK